jgi:hypothetical protein
MGTFALVAPSCSTHKYTTQHHYLSPYLFLQQSKADIHSSNSSDNPLNELCQFLLLEKLYNYTFSVNGILLI